LPPIAAHHLAPLLATAALLAFLVAWGARRLGLATALLGALLLATDPPFLWHALANFKDPPAAALCFAAALLWTETLLRAAKARGVAAALPRWRRFAGLGLLLGLALAAKGNALLLPATVAAGLLLAAGPRALVDVVAQPRLLLRIAAAGLIAL